MSRTAPINSAFEAIKKILAKKVYNDDRVLRVETTGFQVIAGLLEPLVKATWDVHLYETKGLAVPHRSKKLFDLLPEQFVGPGKKVAPDAYTRLQRVVDYVAGMTDSYALDLYRNISGISLP